jgi:hypothetical protein
MDHIGEQLVLALDVAYLTVLRYFNFSHSNAPSSAEGRLCVVREAQLPQAKGSHYLEVTIVQVMGGDVGK